MTVNYKCCKVINYCPFDEKAWMCPISWHVRYFDIFEDFFFLIQKVITIQRNSYSFN